MTPRSLFTIIAKIIGLLFIKDIIEIIPQFLFSITSVTQFDSLGFTIWSLVFTILSIAVYMCAAYYFIFKAEILIDKLQLDKSFLQDNFPLNIHRSTVLSIVIIIIGGLLIVDNIPLLCRSVYGYYQKASLSGSLFNTPDFSYMIIYAVKILIGLVLAGNHQILVNYIERKRKAVAIPAENNTELDNQSE